MSMHAASSSWPETRWDRVLALRDPAARQEALREICEIYMEPIRTECRRWHSSDGEDLAQEFFLWVIQSNPLEQADPLRGRFRSFLLTLLRNFLSKKRRSAMAHKRGGNAEHVEWLEGDGAALAEAPGTAYDRAWADALMLRVINVLQEEAAVSGIRDEVLAAILPSFGADDAEAMSWESVSSQTGVLASTLRAQASRLRLRFRELLQKEVSATTSGSDLEAEMRYLLNLLLGE